MRRLLGLTAAVAVALSACAAPSPTSSPPTSAPASVAPALSVANGTTVPLAIAVNGTVVETVPAGMTEDPIRAMLPARPWNVEARLPSGRVLATMTMSATDAISATASVGAFEDLACGHLALWAGGPRGDHPVASPASPKPCD